jgi:hypothetical protein
MAGRRKQLSCRTESAEQQTLVEFLRAHGVGCFAVPNGAVLGGRNKWGLLQKLRNEGLLPGAPDLVLMDRCADGRPIAIEMKRKAGSSVSDEQVDAGAAMMERGWVVIVAKGADDAVRQLQKLGLERLQNPERGGIRFV